MRHGTEGTPQSGFARSTGDREYQRLQQLILDETGVDCSILVTPHAISIRTKDNSYPDFVLARKTIRGRVSAPIIHDTN